MRKWVLAIWVCLQAMCGIYTFSGSTLPSHIKTVFIPLFSNRTMEPGIAEEMTQIITRAYQTDNTLKVTDKGAHASLQVTITGYNNDAYNHDQQGNVREYRIIIRAAAMFYDEKKEREIWKNDNLIGYGIYGAYESELTGKKRAMDELARILIENTISGW